MQVVDEAANGADKVRCRPRYSCSLLRGDPALICWHFSYWSGVPTEALRHVLSLSWRSLPRGRPLQALARKKPA
jgi:hypothetical protein